MIEKNSASNVKAHKELLKKRLISIFQLCMILVTIIHLILLGIFTDIKIAVLVWISPFHIVLVVLYALSAFKVLPFKKDKIIIKHICIKLSLLIAWFISFFIQVMNSHYHDNIFIHISFVIMVTLDIYLFSFEIVY